GVGAPAEVIDLRQNDLRERAGAGSIVADFVPATVGGRSSDGRTGDRRGSIDGRASDDAGRSSGEHEHTDDGDAEAAGAPVPEPSAGGGDGPGRGGGGNELAGGAADGGSAQHRIVELIRG